ncbi:unnamed protein product [Lepidochelys kempii]
MASSAVAAPAGYHDARGAGWGGTEPGGVSNPEPRLDSARSWEGNPLLAAGSQRSACPRDRDAGGCGRVGPDFQGKTKVWDSVMHVLQHWLQDLNPGPIPLTHRTLPLEI